eukprot:TRINITY_DN37614_c0_g1_i1.p1 TRINITY_DN37614_c0_g1~~TRINITY_DN37614_c0_g1_i1.p1  ORF type:complete len:191 (-),score=31.06 TRINITY_DN37614_c0_g1_i1:203-775(-)
MADAGDEPWDCGACAVFAVNNSISQHLATLGIELDAAETTAIMRSTAWGQKADVFGTSAELYVEQLTKYFEEGKTLPLLGGGAVTFQVAVSGSKEGVEDAVPGSIVIVQMTPEAWVDHYGNVPDDPASAEDEYRLHCMVFESFEDGVATCYNSWQDCKRVQVPNDVFEYVFGNRTLTVSDVQCYGAESEG